METQELTRIKGEKYDALTTRIIRDRAKGRCEYEWWESSLKYRCRELHAEKAIHFQGVVQLQLMPTAGLLDRRVSNLKAYCQRHAYELLKSMSDANATTGRGARTKADKNQTSLF